MSQLMNKSTAPQQEPLRFTTYVDYVSNVRNFSRSLPMDAREAARNAALSAFTPGPEDLQNGKLPPLEQIKINWIRSKEPGTVAHAVITVTRPDEVCVSESRTLKFIKTFKR